MIGGLPARALLPLGWPLSTWWQLLLCRLGRHVWQRTLVGSRATFDRPSDGRSPALVFYSSEDGRGPHGHALVGHALFPDAPPRRVELELRWSEKELECRRCGRRRATASP